MTARIRLFPIILLILLTAPLCRAAGVDSAPGIKPGLVSGRILIDGDRPLTTGRVSFFAVDVGPPSRHGNLRRVPEAITPLKADGNFSVRLPPGRYYVGTMSRDMSEGPGPPAAGEQVYSAVNGGSPLVIEVAGDSEMVLGPIIVRSRVQYPDQRNCFTVTGTVSDAKGKPFAGAYIFVKIDPHAQRPNFISEKTGEDGIFKLLLPAGKSYHLLAKDKVTIGKPTTGKYIGAYNGPDLRLNIIPAPVPISGREGETLKGIDITMHEISTPGPANNEKQESQKPAKPEKNDHPGHSPAEASHGKQTRPADQQHDIWTVSIN